MFLAPLIRSTYRQCEFLNIGSNSPLLFLPSFTIIVLNVENYKDRAVKNLMTAPWRIKALSSACLTPFWCHCCFFCHRRKLWAGVWLCLTATELLRSCKQAPVGSGPFGVRLAEHPRLSTAALGGSAITAPCLLTHTRCQNHGYFFQKHWKIIEALTALTKVQP